MQTQIEQENSLKTEVNELIESSRSLVINTKEELSKVTLILQAGKALQNKITNWCAPNIERWHKGHKEALKDRDNELKPLLELEKKLKTDVLTYSQKVEKEQREIERIANERLAKAAEEQKQKLIQESQRTDNEWDKEVLQEKAQEIVPVTVDVQKKVIEQEGLSIRKTWKAKVVDINLIPREYLIIEANLSALNQYARENKNLKPMPGVEFYEESSTSVRI